MNPDDILLKALFLEEGKYVLACATMRKCSIVDYTTDQNLNDRVILNGFEYIGDVFLVKN
jgi:hypothetical protein